MSQVCGFGQAHTFANAKTIHSAFATVRALHGNSPPPVLTTDLSPQTLARWNGSLFTLSLVTNLLVTTLIAVRLWSVVSLRRQISSK